MGLLIAVPLCGEDPTFPRGYASRSQGPEPPLNSELQCWLGVGCGMGLLLHWAALCLGGTANSCRVGSRVLGLHPVRPLMPERPRVTAARPRPFLGGVGPHGLGEFCVAPVSQPHRPPIASRAVPGPCEPEDLIDGIIFAANYLGSAQLLSERNPSKTIRMTQAQEAVSRVKVGAGCCSTWLFSGDSWPDIVTELTRPEPHRSGGAQGRPDQAGMGQCVL